MEEEQAQTLATLFAAVEDPRIERTRRHKVLDILLIALCGVICGAEGWAEIEEFGRTKEAWLPSFLELPNGIPSHDPFGRVCARIDSQQCETCFLEWVQRISGVMKGVIAVDGKTLRRSHERAHGKKALQRVERLGFGEAPGVSATGAQREKSNEITAIPVLLRQ